MKFSINKERVVFWNFLLGFGLVQAQPLILEIKRFLTDFLDCDKIVKSFQI